MVVTKSGFDELENDMTTFQSGIVCPMHREQQVGKVAYGNNTVLVAIKSPKL